LVENFEAWYDDHFDVSGQGKKLPSKEDKTGGSSRTIANDDQEEEREGIDMDMDAMQYIRSRKRVH